MPFTLVLISAVVAAAAYLRALDFPFISDDNPYIPENAKLAELRVAELWRLFTEPYNSLAEFLPLRDLSYWIDITLFGLNPSAFRAHNILLYLLCLPLVYAITSALWRYFRPGDDASAPWVSAIVTALFALHPAHVEAVVWISGRKDVLCGLFSLLALWFAVNAKREQGLSPLYAGAAIVALLAAALSKAVAVAVAPVIALLWLVFWRDIPADKRRLSLLLWPIAIVLLAIGVAIIFSAAVKTRTPIYWGVETITRALGILGGLTRIAVSPEDRHFFYPLFEDPWFTAMVALGAVVLVAAIASGVRGLRNKPSLPGFALLAFTLICMPSLQLVPYAPPSLISDRFVFLALWPLLLLIVILAWRLKPVPCTILLLIIAIPWVFQTFERPGDYRSFDKLLDSDMRAYPGYYMPAHYKINIQEIGTGSIETYGEILRIAKNISDPYARDIISSLIQSDYAVYVGAMSSGDPREATRILRNVEVKLRQPPAQILWNTPMYNLWKDSQSSLSAQWQYLLENFPLDESVRHNAALYRLNADNYQVPQ
ncbi:MAG: hypothetical protein AB1513_10920 [Pseudomonadota bacterium]